MRAELAKGTNPFAVSPKIDLPQYKDLAFYDQWFELNVQAAVVNEVLGPISWHRTNPGDDDAKPRTATTSTKSTPNPVSNSIQKTVSKPSHPSLPTYFSGGRYKYGPSAFQSHIKNFKTQQFSGHGWKPVAVGYNYRYY